MPALQPQSPPWWVHRLHKQLAERARDAKMYSRYYTGDHPLPWLAPQAADEFRRILKMTRTNVMGLVADATAERINLEGFRVGDDAAADTELWRIWKANRLDSDFDQGILEAIITGQCSLLVAPNARDTKTPHVWVEHPLQTIVAYAPGSGRNDRIAALKVWLDDWTTETFATLYLPDRIYKYRTRQKNVSPEQVRWEPRTDEAGEVNPLGYVPMIEMPNNPRLGMGGISELADVLDVQDRINKTVADRLMTQDFGAFPQKWATAWPSEDEDGHPTDHVDVGRDRMITTDVKEAQLGQFDAAPLDPYSLAKKEDVRDVASRTRTPAQYLLGDMSNVNGETLKASESGLISKVRQRMRPFGEALQDAGQLIRYAAGASDAFTQPVGAIWADPQFRTDGERTDAVVKRLQSGIITLRQAREDYGYTPQQITRMEDDDARAEASVYERIGRPIDDER